MKVKRIFLIASLLTVTLLITSCKRDQIICTGEEAFCALVSAENFNSTGPAIDKFLVTLKTDLNDIKKLEKLKDWLGCKSCVSKAKILCSSCIETYPPQSEIRVTFVTDKRKVELTMDILMDEKLKFFRYHE